MADKEDLVSSTTKNPPTDEVDLTTITPVPVPNGSSKLVQSGAESTTENGKGADPDDDDDVEEEKPPLPPKARKLSVPRDQKRPAPPPPAADNDNESVIMISEPPQPSAGSSKNSLCSPSHQSPDNEAGSTTTTIPQAPEDEIMYMVMEHVEIPKSTENKEAKTILPNETVSAVAAEPALESTNSLVPANYFKTALSPPPEKKLPSNGGAAASVIPPEPNPRPPSTFTTAIAIAGPSRKVTGTRSNMSPLNPITLQDIVSNTNVLRRPPKQIPARVHIDLPESTCRDVVPYYLNMDPSKRPPDGPNPSTKQQQTQTNNSEHVRKTQPQHHRQQQQQVRAPGTPGKIVYADLDSTAFKYKNPTAHPFTPESIRRPGHPVRFQLQQQQHNSIQMERIRGINQSASISRSPSSTAVAHNSLQRSPALTTRSAASVSTLNGSPSLTTRSAGSISNLNRQERRLRNLTTVVQIAPSRVNPPAFTDTAGSHPPPSSNGTAVVLPLPNTPNPDSTTTRVRYFGCRERPTGKVILACGIKKKFLVLILALMDLVVNFFVGAAVHNETLSFIKGMPLGEEAGLISMVGYCVILVSGMQMLLDAGTFSYWFSQGTGEIRFVEIWISSTVISSVIGVISLTVSSHLTNSYLLTCFLVGWVTFKAYHIAIMHFYSKGRYIGYPSC